MAEDQKNTITVKGVEYQCKPLGLSDWAEYLDWVRADYMAVVQKHAAALPAGDRLEVLKAAALRLPVITLSGPEVAAALTTRAGQARLSWMMIRKADGAGTLTPDDLMED